MFQFLMILLFTVVIMWVLVVLPQKRRQQAQDRMLAALKPGDYVMTAGGLYGTVTDLGADDVGIEVSPDVEVRIAKRAIGQLVPPDEIEEVEIDDEERPPSVGDEGADAPAEAAREKPGGYPS